MWIQVVLLFVLPFILLCTDQKYDAYESLYNKKSLLFPTDGSLDLFTDFDHNSSFQASSILSSNIFVGLANNYQQQAKLLAYSLQQELIDRFLRKCTLEQFKTYVVHQNITDTKTLVSHVEWWNYKVFWDYVELLPDGHEEVVLFAQKFLKNYASSAKRALCWFAGIYKTGLREVVKQKLKEHNARHHIKEEQSRQKHEGVQQQKQLHDQIYVNIVQDIQQILPLIRRWETSDNKRWHKRAAVWKNQQTATFAMHHFDLSQNQQQFCALNGDQLGTLYGMALQKELHQELLDCIEQAVPLYTNELFISSIQLAYESNRAGFVRKAATLVDFCYAIADGLLYGTGKAVSATYHTVFHPLDTAIKTIQSAYAVVQTLSHVAKIPVELIYYYATDTQQFYARCDDICDYNKALYNCAADYLFNTPAPIMVKDATGLITELVLTHRFMQLTTKLCTDVSQKIPALLEACAAEFVEAECVPIGIPGLKIDKAQLFAKEKQLEKPRYGGNFTTAITELEKELAAVKKIQEFFDNRKFGQVLKNYCEKIPGKTYAGKAIYKIVEDVPNSPLKSGFVFYLDSQHMNHLEVFRMQGSKGISEFVLNFDGQINIAKTNMPSFVNRILRL